MKKAEGKTRPRISVLALLAPNQVRWARKKYKEGASQMDIALALKVSQCAISMMLRGKTYKEVV